MKFQALGGTVLLLLACKGDPKPGTDKGESPAAKVAGGQTTAPSKADKKSSKVPETKADIG